MKLDHLPPIPDNASARIERNLFDGVEGHNKRHRTRTRVIAIGAAGLLVAGSASIAGVTIANNFQLAHSTYCYGAASTSARMTEAGTPSDINGENYAGATSSTRAAAAIDLCASVWKAGVFDDSSSRSAPSTAVPDLIACLRSDQLPSVFPRPQDSTLSDGSFCNSLGLDAFNH